MSATSTTEENTKPKEKTDYTEIAHIEKPPQGDWFLERTDDHGHYSVYLRMCVTGLLPRIIGPFASKEIALWCLDELISDVTETIECTVGNLVEEHIVRPQFHARIHPVLIDDPLFHHPSPGLMRQPKKATRQPKPSKRKAA